MQAPSGRETVPETSESEHCFSCLTAQVEFSLKNSSGLHNLRMNASLHTSKSIRRFFAGLGDLNITFNHAMSI